MISNDRGFTLMELLIAGTIAAIAATGIHSALNTTFNIQREMVKRQSSLGQNNTAFAMIRISQRLEVADRFLIRSADDIQLRIPPTDPDPSQFDVAANYHWERFKYDGLARQLNFYPDGDCSNPEVLAKDIDLVSFAYMDEGPPFNAAPVVQDCFAGEDCNLIEYQLVWNNGLAAPDERSQEFHGLVASRNIADSNVNSVGSDTGDQLIAAPGPPPPAPGGC